MNYILGTAQFGLDYGISNNSGKVKKEDLVKLLLFAKESGFKYLDTANAYGDSENRIGEMYEITKDFDLITKTAHIDPDKNYKKNLEYIKKQFFESLKKMKRESVETLLVHNSIDISIQNGEKIYQYLAELKKNGLVKKIGVSVYSTEEAISICKDFSIDVLQFPINVLDQSFDKSKTLTLLKNKNIELHARSIFLQGLLLMDIQDIDPYFQRIKPKIESYKKSLKKHGLDKVDGALNYIKRVDSIDALVIGVENKSQLSKIVNSLKKSLTEIEYDEFAISDADIINPSKWQI